MSRGIPVRSLLSTVQAPNADNIYITVWAVGSSTGMSYTIYLDYVNSNQYHKAVFTRGSGNLWTVGIYDGTTLLGSVTMTDLGIFPNRTILSACLHNGIFQARIDPAPVYEEEVSVDDEADHGGTLFGLRHDNSTPTKFDDFTANQVILGDFHRCYGCRCRCDDEPMCKSLNIEIDATGLGSCLDGISTTLEWEKDATGMEYWSGTLDLGADGAWGVKFLCGNGDPETPPLGNYQRALLVPERRLTHGSAQRLCGRAIHSP